MTAASTVNIDLIPTSLKAVPHWVAWKYETRDGKPTKIPYNPRTGRRADSTNPETGAPFDVALAVYESGDYAGLGFILTGSEFVAIDLDHCVDAAGVIEPWAVAILDHIRSYSDISPSSTGVRILARGSLPPGRRRAGRIEMYDTDRYVTITGHHLDRYPREIHERTDQLAALHAETFPSTETPKNAAPTGRVNLADDDLLQRIRNSAQGAKFERLWSGDTGEYSSASEGDLALCCTLAFWTNRDPEHIERLVRQSGRYREKWERRDYVGRTINRAIELTTETYQPGATLHMNGATPEGSVASIASVAHEPMMYPDPPDPSVYQGFAGEIVNAIEPETEADPVALLLMLLAAVGNIAGRGPHWRVGTRPHHLRLFPVLVGETSKARKGTAWSAVKPVLRVATADDNGNSLWLAKNVANGLSSGEGLIWSVRDPIRKTEAVREKKQITGYQEIIVDPGIDDKRLLVMEEEFASVLKVMGRDGNTLSPVIRQAWDDGDLRTMTKNSPAVATGAHITIVGHVTRDELRRHLTSTEMGNGFANRITWASVRRSKLLPDGGNPHPEVIHALGDQLRSVFETAEHIGLIDRDDDARELWHAAYGQLSEGGVGLLGAITSRAEAQVMRLAAIYALMDESNRVTVEHLNAALKLWEYCEDSVRYIFGDSLGDPVADTILDALRNQGELSRTDIRDLFGRHQSSGRLDNALGSLIATGKVRREQRATGGRPTEVWIAT